MLPSSQPRAGPRPGPSLSMADLRKTGSWKKLRTICLDMCGFTCFICFLENFANMASPAEITIPARTASKFCAKRRAVQPPPSFVPSCFWPTTEITERCLEHQPKEPWLE